jgi:phosphatidylglycerophosphate synthase
MMTSFLRALPNGLSLARLILGIGFPWVPANWRVVVIVVAALSDLADGAVSRRLHATSPTGRILDPIADKVFVLSVVATLLFEERLQLWQVALLGLRDWAVLVGAACVTVREGWSTAQRMSPTLLGKATTALQFAFVLTLLINEPAAQVVFVPTAVVSGAAAVGYLWRGVQMVKPPSSRTAQRSMR